MKTAGLMLMLAFCAQALGRTTWAPFDGPAAGRPQPPVAPSIAVPSGVPQLSVARPYTVFIGQAALDSLSPGAKVPAALAADWNHVWRVDATIGASGLTDLRRRQAIRGRVTAEGDMDAVLAMVAAADYPGVVIRPRLTGDAVAGRFGVGFEIRMAADLIQRIPFPTLDLRQVDDPAWARAWIDDCVRNGVVGLRVLTNEGSETTGAVTAALAPLEGMNVYLPPASEVAIFVDPADRREAFDSYAGLRSSGVWPEFVSEAQVTAKAVSLARYRIVVLPRRPSRAARVELLDAARRGLTVVVLGGVEWRGARVIAAKHNGLPAITERRVGEGRWIAAGTAPWSPDGGWTSFWDGLLRDAGVPRRPWLEAVTAANVHRLTGTYTLPSPAK